MSLALQTHLTDTRSVPRWTKLDRARACHRATVSIGWPRNPFGLRPVSVFPLVQPGVFRNNGQAVKLENEFNASLGAFMDEDPSRYLLSGQPVTIWQSGTQSVQAFDLSRLDVVEGWVERILAHYPWASGIHHDYLTELSWLAPQLSLAYWRAYETGYALALTRLAHDRHDWTLLGQQYHLTRLTPYAHGLYVEESPGHFGQSFDDHRANMRAAGKGWAWTFEIRNPDQFPKAYTDLCAEFVREQGCYLSWGRDATALVGVPE